MIAGPSVVGNTELASVLPAGATTFSLGVGPQLLSTEASSLGGLTFGHGVAGGELRVFAHIKTPSVEHYVDRGGIGGTAITPWGLGGGLGWKHPIGSFGSASSAIAASGWASGFPVGQLNADVGSGPTPNYGGLLALPVTFAPIGLTVMPAAQLYYAPEFSYMPAPQTGWSRAASGPSVAWLLAMTESWYPVPWLGLTLEVIPGIAPGSAPLAYTSSPWHFNMSINPGVSVRLLDRYQIDLSASPFFINNEFLNLSYFQNGALFRWSGHVTF